MPHVHADELSAWAEMAHDAREKLLKIQASLKKVEGILLTIDQQATAASEPDLLTAAEEEELSRVKEVERETV